MANGNNGTAPEAAKDEDQQPQINVLGQYIKDLSFENPGAPRSLRGPGKNPNIQINFNVQAHPIGDDVFEVVLTMEAAAKNEDGALYNLELVYAGGFRLKNLPQQALRPVLFIECPALLFPFVRRLVADLTREGGFPPLLLDPIDFASLFRQRLMQDEAAGGEPAVQ
ncbi:MULTISPECIES: protein-export chaperone SecB [Rhodomicrobium]|uniref:protein-export chaperone SecB n=1 Tax=Rhodomicrobium TaxID=1068 RepID=UPI000B4B86DA|nr:MULTISPECIES: protein-export chaperone SecB [Rhodomicrobium]